MRKTRKHNKNKTRKHNNNKNKTRKQNKKRKSLKTISNKKKYFADISCGRMKKSIKQKTVTIGIMTAPWLTNIKDSLITSYMASSYVKWLESSGALIIPIEFDLPKPKMLGFLRQLNGIVLIGGGIDNIKTHNLNQFLSYQDSLYYILNYAIYQNKANNYFPVWCTCMSFEMAAIFFAENIRLKKQEELSKYLTSAGDIGEDYLHWTTKSSKIKKIFTKKEIIAQKKYPSIFMAHCYAIAINSKLGKNLAKVANITATNISSGVCGKKGVKYVTAYELKDYPIYGVQFHPEKPPFEYINDNMRVPKTTIAIDTSYKMSKFFIDEAKKSSNIWIGGKNYFDFTINDYNIYNKNITKRLKRLQKETINSSARRVGDAGVYLFGPALVPLEGDILNNPWKNVMENKNLNKAKKEDNEPDNP